MKRRPPIQKNSPSEIARGRFREFEKRPLFLANWVEAVFIHFRVEPGELQLTVPFDLDLHEGSAFVSLVAFKQEQLRFARAPSITRWMGNLAANHAFLNFRTYVKYGRERAIYFIAEWVPDRLALWFGPKLYGFPYQLAQLQYHHGSDIGLLQGRVSGLGAIEYQARLPVNPTAAAARPGTLDEFLTERYIALTTRRGISRFFQVWHEPWPLTPIPIEISDLSLISFTWPWFRKAEPAGAHYSRGVTGVWIGRPHAQTAT